MVTARNLFKLTRCPSLQDSWRKLDDAKIQSDPVVFKQKFFQCLANHEEISEFLLSQFQLATGKVASLGSCAAVPDQDLNHTPDSSCGQQRPCFSLMFFTLWVVLPWHYALCPLGDFLPRIKIFMRHIVEFSRFRLSIFHHWRLVHVSSLHFMTLIPIGKNAIRTDLRFSCAALHCACLNWDRGFEKHRALALPP